ncbi:hypothetical protein [Bifidobacterium moukalabense]|uniref:Uncharacterized protein n=1 Tax=Bifidobacterium moukalabense DSM 27321 TaxID=1435051 RepID=W4NAC7_9BIFI|nr:hypothetical protein [Bifidobacterium moukalabense]ETY71421.1 hypothetical protein BMOU_0913 [Bifidobacterium moukalabense DSM 27321]
MPKIKLQNLQKAINTGKYAVDVGKEVLPVLQPLIEQYAPKVVEQVRDAANTAAKKTVRTQRSPS